jgi:regulator of sirC expression with transglutaminase-like and TPR domain
VTRTAAERVLLARVAGSRGDAVNLARAAVLLARTVCPEADPDRVESALEGLAAVARRDGASTGTAEARGRVLAAVLSTGRGLRGDHEAYDDPRNSCLECVLDRGRGLPLSLSILWMETGRRAGWRVEGVGLPGHFLVRVHGADGGSALADPFHGGGVLARADLKHLLQTMAGEPVPLAGLDLAGRSPGEILLRMLRNLRGSYRRRGDRLRGLAVAEDMLLLSPGLPEALRDRGLLRIEGGDRREGLGDLRSYLEAAPADPGADGVLRLVATLTSDGEGAN